MDELLAFNGKAGKLNEGVFTKLKLLCQPEKAKQRNSQQGNETTLVSKGDVPLYNTRLVIRSVEKPWAGDLSEEDIENNLEQTILHYAIVPQVAYYRNEQTVSFIAPLFGGGTLDELIPKERDKTAEIETKRPSKRKAEKEAERSSERKSEIATERPSERKQEIAAERPQTLEWKDKLRILYQICRAIEYLHQPPKCERKPVSHGNICMQNVLLDENKNARLLFLAPKSVEGGVGEEQFQEDKKHDVQNFKEMAHDVLIQSAKEATRDVLAHIKRAVTMTDLKTELESDLRREDIKYWIPSQDDGKKKDADGKKKDKCEICCVNKPEKTFVKLQHGISCRSKIKMCVGCLWNWRYNPVKCHSCDQEKIRSPVGDGWGALLIAGIDDEDTNTTLFEKDIDKIKRRLITEATMMGVWDDYVIIVKKSTTTYDEQLKKAFIKIATLEIDTLVLVYSGHHGVEGFRLDSDPLKDVDLEKKINELKHVMKVIVFLDGCLPQKLNLGNKRVLQFNAVTSKQGASLGPDGSLFINNIVDILTKLWTCKKCCQNTPVIKDYDIRRCLKQHPISEMTEPSHHTYTDGEFSDVLTFRLIDSGWLKALDKSLDTSPFQDILYRPETNNMQRHLLAVFITIEAILPAVKSVAVQLHTAILRRATHAGSVCSQDHGIITDTSRLSCRFHDTFRDEIIQRHKRRPSWRNATTDTWHYDAFSVAKLFMQPSGYVYQTNFDEINFNGIAAFMFNCSHFPASVKVLADQARVSVNKIQHIPHMKSSALTDQAITECIDSMSKLLDDPTFNTDKEVQEALKQLDELKTTLVGDH